MMTSYPDTAFRTTSWISSPAFSPFPYIDENFATFPLTRALVPKVPPLHLRKTSPSPPVLSPLSSPPLPRAAISILKLPFSNHFTSLRCPAFSPVKIMILYPLASQSSSVLQKGLFSHWSCSVKSQCFSSLKFLPGILDYNCQRVSCTLGVDYFTQEKIAACRAGTRGQIILGSISCSQKHWQFINIAHLFPNICDNWWRELL